MAELIKCEFPDTPFSFDLDHDDNNHYKGINNNTIMEKSHEISWLMYELNDDKLTAYFDTLEHKPINDFIGYSGRIRPAIA